MYYALGRLIRMFIRRCGNREAKSFNNLLHKLGEMVLTEGVYATQLRLN